MSKHTAAEVLAMSREFGDTVGHMLADYADLLAAQEKAEPVAWRPVVGFEELYEISDTGDLRTIKSGIVQAKHSTGGGYVKADLWKDGVRTQTSIHRLVAKAFLGDGDGLEVNHKNGIKTDNRVENLEWVTHRVNVDHAIETDLLPRGLEHHKGKLSSEDVFAIYDLGATGITHSEIANRFNVSRKAITDILSGKERKTEWRVRHSPHPPVPPTLSELSAKAGDSLMANARFMDELLNAYRAGRLREVPEGFVVVPSQPTTAMLDALTDRMWADHTIWTVWRAMLAAKDAL